MDNPNQDNDPVEPIASEDTEGGSGTETTPPESIDQDEINEIFEEKPDTSRDEARQKTRQGLVNKQIEILASAPPEEHEEILSRYPGMRDEIEAEFNSLITTEDDRIARLETEIQNLKNQSKKTEAQSSREEFDQFLKKSGYAKDDFNRQYGKTFIASVKAEMEMGNSRSQAVRTAIGEMVINHGFVPKSAIKEAEERGMASAGMVMPSMNAKIAPTSKKSFERELAEYNEELASVGVSPISEEAFKQYKEQN